MSRRRTEQYPHGPGGTHWYSNEENKISRCRHNDTGWCSSFADISKPGEKPTAERICRWMREAYEAGIEDGKEQIRRAIGVSR